VHGNDAINTNQNHLILFTHPSVRRASPRDQDTIPDIPATAARITCPLADMDADEFTHAHRAHRVRGAFRLLGSLGSLTLAFLQSLDGLMSYHDGRYVLLPIPVIAGWLAGELVVAVHRMHRACESPIPRARVLRGRAMAPRRE
jgi:hypothetical protein